MSKRYAVFTTLGEGTKAVQSATTVTRDAGNFSNPRAQYGTLNLPKSGGEWYAEFIPWVERGFSPSFIDNTYFGIAPNDEAANVQIGTDAGRRAVGIDRGNGQIRVGGVLKATIGTIGWGSVVGIRAIFNQYATGDRHLLIVSINGVVMAQVRFWSATATGWHLAGTVYAGASAADKLYLFVNTGTRKLEHGGGDSWHEIEGSTPEVRVSTGDYIGKRNPDMREQNWQSYVLDSSSLAISRAISFWPWSHQGATTSAASFDVYSDATTEPLAITDVRDVPVDIQQVSGEQHTIASMVVERVEVRDDSVLTVTMRDAMATLDRPLQRMLIRPDADPSVANTPWPVTLGAARSVSPVMVDDNNYVLHDDVIAGWGYVRDAGDPWVPGAIPPDYIIRPDGRGFIVNANVDPQGRVTADASSVGGGAAPAPAEDILQGSGEFNGLPGSVPAGWTVNQGGPRIAAPYAALTASVSPSAVGYSHADGWTYYSHAATCAASGGEGDLQPTYDWLKVSGDSKAQPSHPNGAATAWYVTSPGSLSVWRCLVIKGGESVYTGNVTVTM